jgi:hypothetical protein
MKACDAPTVNACCAWQPPTLPSDAGVPAEATEDRHRDGHPEGAPELLGDVDQPEAAPASFAGTLSSAAWVTARTTAVADGEQQQAGEHVPVRRRGSSPLASAKLVTLSATPPTIALACTRWISTRLVSCETRNTVTGSGRKANPVQRGQKQVLQELGQEEQPEHPPNNNPGHVGDAAAVVEQARGAGLLGAQLVSTKVVSRTAPPTNEDSVGPAVGCRPDEAIARPAIPRVENIPAGRRCRWRWVSAGRQARRGSRAGRSGC